MILITNIKKLLAWIKIKLEDKSNFVLAIANILLVIITCITLIYTIFHNNKLFQSQLNQYIIENRPYLNVTDLTTIEEGHLSKDENIGRLIGLPLYNYGKLPAEYNIETYSLLGTFKSMYGLDKGLIMPNQKIDVEWKIDYYTDLGKTLLENGNNICSLFEGSYIKINYKLQGSENFNYFTKLATKLIELPRKGNELEDDNQRTKIMSIAKRCNNNDDVPKTLIWHIEEFK